MTSRPDQLHKIEPLNPEAEIQKLVQKYSAAIVQKAFVRALEDDCDDLLRACFAVVISMQRSTVNATGGTKVLEGEVVCHDIFGDSLKEWAAETGADLSKMPQREQKTSL